MQNMCDYVEKDEAKKIVDNCKFILQNESEKTNDDGESKILLNTYLGKQSFGYTDYKDHRHDTLEQIKALVYPSITSNYDGGRHQRIHYYQNMDINRPYTKVLLTGYYGGISAMFID